MATQNVLLRKFNSKTISIIDKRNEQFFADTGVKRSRSEFINELCEEALFGEVANYKKDIFDKVTNQLTNKFQEYIDSNNQLIMFLMEVEEQADE